MTDANGFTVKEILINLESKVDKVIADHEERIRVLEDKERKWGWPASIGGGVGAAVAAMAAIFHSNTT